MTHATAVHGTEIVDLVSTHPDGIELSELEETIVDRFGRYTTFHTSSRRGLDFNHLLDTLEMRHKLRIVRGVVYPAGAQVVCSS